MHVWIYENSVKEIAPCLCVFFLFRSRDTVNKADDKKIILRMPVFFPSTHYLPSVAGLKCFESL